MRVSGSFVSFTLLVLALPVLASAAQRELTPNTNNRSGVLPSGYEKLIFRMGDGNFAAEVVLPAKPRNGDEVEVISNALWRAVLPGHATVYGIDRILLNKGSHLLFKYDAGLKRWNIPAPFARQLTACANGEQIAVSSDAFTQYSLSDGCHRPVVRLPASAQEGALVRIRSSATWSADIAPINTAFAATRRLQRGDAYVLRFSAELGKWLDVEAPMREQLPVAILPRPVAAKTLVAMADGRWTSRLTLPGTAGDRDRYIIRSTATYTATIAPDHIIASGPMAVQRGDEYEFMYVAADKRWEVIRAPTRLWQFKDVPATGLPALTAPMTLVKAGNANYQRRLILPPAPKGSRVEVTTQATYSFDVEAAGLKETLSTGEKVTFVVDGQGRWTRETRTIDLMMLYSSKAVAQLGSESAARAKMVQGFELTNEALANSGANFRYRLKSARMVTANPAWTDLHDPLYALRTDPVVQGWRNEAKADGIYYMGTEGGGVCGLGFVRGSATNMVSAGVLSCGNTVMRHEMGHNMGLIHTGGGNGYAEGYGLVRTIMNGNAIPYYSTPSRHTVEGLAMGIPGRIDGTRAMNEFSQTVAGYR